MGEEKQLFKVIAGVHPRYQTPHVAALFTASLGIVYVLSRTYEQLAQSVVLGGWPFWALSIAGVFVLRKRQPDLERPYRVPGYPIVPLVFFGGVGGDDLERVGAAAARDPLRVRDSGCRRSDLLPDGILQATRIPALIGIIGAGFDRSCWPEVLSDESAPISGSLSYLAELARRSPARWGTCRKEGRHGEHSATGASSRQARPPSSNQAPTRPDVRRVAPDSRSWRA